MIVPTDLIQGLQGATEAHLSNIEVHVFGLYLRWPALEVDVMVRDLALGIFGLESWMSELGRRDGSSKSPAKAAAVRADGLKCGRPRKAGAES